MRGRHLFIACAVAAFVMASASSAGSTSTGRVALARIAGPAVAVTIVLPPTTTTTSTTAPAARGTVALTFDDGPSRTFTPQVMAILARYGVKATFFIVGDAAAQHPDIVRAIVAAGHSVGNHTWSHAALPLLDEEGFRREVDRTQTLLTEQVGRRIECVRPPFGKIDARSRAAMQARGLRVVRWTKDTEDWKLPGVDAIVARALAGAESGGVILLHDSGPDMSQTVAALPAIIEGIRAQGFALAPIC